MSTSGVTAWSMTARSLAIKAMKELGLLASGEEPEASEITDLIEAMNGLIKSWQMQGVTLGRSSTITQAVLGGAAGTTLPAGVRTIQSARIVNSATSERLLFPWTRADYFALPNKAAVGLPTAYYLDRQDAAPALYLWPVSTTGFNLKLDVDRIVQTVTDENETVDIREEYQETLWTNLALRVSGMFGPTAAPSPELIARAQRLEQQTLDADRPDEYVAWADG